MFKIIDKHLGILKDFEGKYIYIFYYIHIYDLNLKIREGS